MTHEEDVARMCGTQAGHYVHAPFNRPISPAILREVASQSQITMEGGPAPDPVGKARFVGMLFGLLAGAFLGGCLMALLMRGAS